jgi:hypothetical protein
MAYVLIYKLNLGISSGLVIFYIIADFLFRGFIDLTKATLGRVKLFVMIKNYIFNAEKIHTYVSLFLMLGFFFSIFAIFATSFGFFAYDLV